MKRIGLLIVLCGLACVASPGAQTPAKTQDSGTEKKAEGEKNMIGWQWANFVVLAGILVYVVRKYGSPYFSGETETIRSGIEDGRQRRAAADRQTAEVQARLDNLGAEIESLRKTLIADQAAQAERVRQQTIEEMDRIHANAEQQVTTLTKAARLELQTHASRLALELAGQRLRERLTPAGQHSLVEVFLENLKA